MAGNDRPNVLIVEDEPDINNLLADVLTAFDFTPLQAMTGQQALSILAVQKPAAILLDLMLPDINGYEICRQIKTSRATRMIPVLILTALDRPVDRRYGYEVGADDYLTKPFTPEGLVARLRACMVEREEACSACAHLIQTLDLSASINDLKAFNSLATCLYCHTDLEPAQIEALRSGLATLSDTARQWAAGRRFASPVRLTLDLTAERLRLLFQPACEGAQPFLDEHLDADATIPSLFTDAGVIDRVTKENGMVVFEKSLPPPDGPAA